jgi:hypothetical protein
MTSLFTAISRFRFSVASLFIWAYFIARYEIMHSFMPGRIPCYDYADDSEIDVLIDDDDWDEIDNGCLCYAHYLCDGNTCGCKEYKCSCWQPFYNLS